MNQPHYDDDYDRQEAEYYGEIEPPAKITTPIEEPGLNQLSPTIASVLRRIVTRWGGR